MEPAKAVKKYKDEVAKLKVQVGEYTKKVREGLGSGKVKELGL